MTRVIILPQARQEFLDAAGRYNDISPNLGNAFIAEVERVADRVAAFAEHGAPTLPVCVESSADASRLQLFMQRRQKASSSLR